MNTHYHTIELEAVVTETLGQSRLDQAAAQLFPEYSRSLIQSWIKSGSLTVNGMVGKAKDKVLGGERLCVVAQLEEKTGEWQAEEIPLTVVYEDEHLIIINKATDMVVHPAIGHAEGTLVNALLHHAPELKTLPRAGIIHRLDKDTTGLLVVAKNLQAHNSLVHQLQARSMGREYEAVVASLVTGGGSVDAPIGRHPRNRLKMAVVDGGKAAVTHYRVLKRYASHSHLRLQLESGRTHQIRVHMAHLNMPIVGDPLYSSRARLSKGASEALRQQLLNFGRQALHAKKLTLSHPATEEEVSWEIPLPEDMQQLLSQLAEG